MGQAIFTSWKEKVDLQYTGCLSIPDHQIRDGESSSFNKLSANSQELSVEVDISHQTV